MEIYEKRGRWVVKTSEGKRKFSTQAEAEAFAGLGSPVEEPSDGYEEEEYTEEFDFTQEEDSSEEEDSSTFIGVGEENSESESEEE